MGHFLLEWTTFLGPVTATAVESKCRARLLEGFQNHSDSPVFCGVFCILISESRDGFVGISSVISFYIFPPCKRHLHNYHENNIILVLQSTIIEQGQDFAT